MSLWPRKSLLSASLHSLVIDVVVVEIIIVIVVVYVVIAIPVHLLDDDGIADQIVTSSVESEET